MHIYVIVYGFAHCFQIGQYQDFIATLAPDLWQAVGFLDFPSPKITI
jgi:hypothetical protein